jgi:hypothetical protein
MHLTPCNAGFPFMQLLHDRCTGILLSLAATSLTVVSSSWEPAGRVWPKSWKRPSASDTTAKMDNKTCGGQPAIRSEDKITEDHFELTKTLSLNASHIN